MLSSTERKGKPENAINHSKEIIVFPNPASETISLKCTEDLTGFRYLIKDISGRTVCSGYYNSKINIKAEAGIYFLELRKDNSYYQCKFTTIKK